MINQDIKQKTEVQAQEEKVEKIDLKLVTFTLGGKDYGIDIMKIKEISKANKFTYVPNTSPFVCGVYNLRGDIISVIDLRKFFNVVPEDEKKIAGKKNKKNLDNMLILRLEDHVMAVIVDSIDKVIGVSHESVQPPHPLFGDINIKYISGVVEKNDKLFVLLDVERIFNSDTTSDTEMAVSKEQNSSGVDFSAGQNSQQVISSRVETVTEDPDDLNLQFIEESLASYKRFFSSDVNQQWLKSRFRSWKTERNDKNKEVQLKDSDDVDNFLSTFSSTFSGRLWSEQFLHLVADLLPNSHSGTFCVWNPGCGNGYESYSIACLLKERFSNSNIKVLAQDNDLISISTAPGLLVDSSAPEFYKKYLSEGTKGHQFSTSIKESIIFEYHDILHNNNTPPLDMVVMRDIISLFQKDIQERLLDEVYEAMKPNGLLMLGDNEEVLNGDLWEPLKKDDVVIYRKK